MQKKSISRTYGLSCSRYAHFNSYIFRLLKIIINFKNAIIIIFMQIFHQKNCHKAANFEFLYSKSTVGVRNFAPDVMILMKLIVKFLNLWFYRSGEKCRNFTTIFYTISTFCKKWWNRSYLSNLKLQINGPGAIFTHLTIFFFKTLMGTFKEKNLKKKTFPSVAP